MRYYQIVIQKQNGALYTFKSLGGAIAPGITLSSLLPTGPQNPQQGLTNPAALLVELDCGVANITDPDNQGAMVRIWGLGLQDIGSAADLNGLFITVSAGMAKGLPLANPAQAGVIVQGQILQAFGNWVGTAQTIDLIIQAGGPPAKTGFSFGSPDLPGNFPFSMPAGTTLAQAIASTLSIGIPNLPPTISISPNLTLGYDVTGHYQSLAQFSSFVQALSQGIIGDASYPGVTVSVTNGQSIRVYDGMGPSPISATKAIAVQDLLGQPTWIDNGTISVKTVLRADIHMGDTVSIPPTIFTQSSAAPQRFANNPQNRLTFSGLFQVQQVHHYGHSRQPDSSSWNTTYQMTPAVMPTPAAPSPRSTAAPSLPEVVAT